MVLNIIFLKFNNENILFVKIKFIIKFYTNNKSYFLLSKYNLLIKKFLIIILDINNKIFIIYIII